MENESIKRFCVKYGKKIVAAAVWIALWQLAAWMVGSRILLVGPLETLQALGQRVFQGSFWLTVGFS
ncbi:MAG: hypothetical protein K2I21_13860, partial [Acetatifactor sp.]|nr:hypothetical protein [Acetatifactor sp.]